MIIIAGHLEIDPERTVEALTTAKPFIEGALTQSGCEAYSWAADPNAPGRVHVFERWRDEAALSAHFEGQHYLAMLQCLGGFGLRSANVEKYRVDLHEPVYDATNKPRADFFSEGS